MPVVMPYAHKLMSPSRNVVSTIRTSSTESSTNERPNANQSLARIRKARQTGRALVRRCIQATGSLFILPAAVVDINIGDRCFENYWIDYGDASSIVVKKEKNGGKHHKNNCQDCS